MRFALIGRQNGVGLSADAALLRELLEPAGHFVESVDPSSHSMARCDVGIFLETVAPHLIEYVRHPIALLNLEWFQIDWFPHLARFKQFWAKTEHAHATLTQMGLPSHLTGFMSYDQLDLNVPRTLTCLHVKGQSPLKNTEAVLDVWKNTPDLPPLTIISTYPLEPVPNVRVLPQVSRTELIREMNTAAIHLCPSRTEGWGHYIVESMSTGALVITTDGPPMNEIVCPEWGLLVRVAQSRPRFVRCPITPDILMITIRDLLLNPKIIFDMPMDRVLDMIQISCEARYDLPALATQYEVDTAHLAATVRHATTMSEDQRKELGERARAIYLMRCASFKRRATALLSRLT